MKKPIAVALVVIGLILLVMGLNASDSLSSQFSELFSGSPSDKAIWLIVAGVGALVVGGLSLRPRRG